MMGIDKFSSTLDSLTGFKVNLYIGEEVVKGKLVGVEEDHVILENENNYIYYYNLDHIQAITKNTKQFQAQEFTGEIIITPSMQQVLSSLMLQWVTILCMNKQKFAGILSEINSDFATLINGEERILIKLNHISNILKGYVKDEESNSKNENNQSENSNQNHSQSQANEKNNQPAASNSKEKDENKKGKEEKNHKEEKSNKGEKNRKEESSSKNKKNDKKKEKQFNGSKMTQKKEETAKVVKLKLARPTPSTPLGPPHPPHLGPKHETVEHMNDQGEKEKEKDVKNEKNDAKRKNIESQPTEKTNRYVGDRYSIQNIVRTASYTGWPMTNTKKFVN